MKAKQKNIRVFELNVENEDDFFSYMDKNIILLKDYMLLVNGTITSKMQEYLDEKGCCYKSMKDCSLKLGAKEIKKPTKEESKPIEIVQYVEVEDEKAELTTLTFHTPIRSGTIVEHDGDITIFGRVNSGAKVICGGNLSVFDLVDGIVECDGDYMILKDIQKGYAVFNGDILEKELFNSTLKKITKSIDGPVIKELI
jgi:septum site-determining protein MinC